MDVELLFLCLLCFVIHLVGTLGYAVKIAGTRAGRVALALSLFNIMMLVSRTSNSFLAPVLSKRVETNLIEGATADYAVDFHWLIVD